MHRNTGGHLEYTWLIKAMQAFDLVVDTDAKTRWQRAKPSGMVVGLPGYLVGGEWVGVSYFSTA